MSADKPKPERKSKPSRGLVLGKFMPPHRGHLFLVDFAHQHADEVYVVVGTLAAEPIGGRRRFEWMRQLCPRSTVIHLQDENPQDPSEHPDFWKIWRESLLRVLPQPLDYVFAGEAYGERLAHELGARFISADRQHQGIAISGTQIRHDPRAHWSFIPELVRPYFMRRVAVVGPESTGKSTLCERLATHYDAQLVPEFARAHIEQNEGRCDFDDMLPIAQGQAESELALAARARGLLICDTDRLATKVWSQTLFDRVPQGLDTIIGAAHYDLTLLLSPDVPWVPDQVRYLPEGGEAFFATYAAALAQQGRGFTVVEGDWQRRFETACAAIDGLLSPDAGLLHEL